MEIRDRLKEIINYDLNIDWDQLLEESSSDWNYFSNELDSLIGSHFNEINPKILEDGIINELLDEGYSPEKMEIHLREWGYLN